MVFSQAMNSSMNSTSPSSRLVKRPARSPAFSIVGPLVLVEAGAHELGQMWASVVLPRPGGPLKDVVDGFLPLFGRRHGDFQALFDLRSGEFREREGRSVISNAASGFASTSEILCSAIA